MKNINNIKIDRNSFRIYDYEIVTFTIKRIEDFLKVFSSNFEITKDTALILKMMLLKEFRKSEIKKNNKLSFYYRTELNSITEDFFYSIKDSKILPRKKFII